jgi:hypothetical protein
MADGQHNPTRRALLGAAVGVPLSLGTGAAEARGPLHQASPGPPPRPGEERWAEALAAFRAAEAELRGVERATAGGSAEEEEIWLPLYEARLDEMSGAVRAMMVAPAPDLGAFAVKLELLFEHELEPHSADEEVLAVVLADVRRLVLRQAQDERVWRGPSRE